ERLAGDELHEAAKSDEAEVAVERAGAGRSLERLALYGREQDSLTALAERDQVVYWPLGREEPACCQIGRRREEQRSPGGQSRGVREEVANGDRGLSGRGEGGPVARHGLVEIEQPARGQAEHGGGGGQHLG